MQEIQKYYRTIMTIEILSDFPYGDQKDLKTVAYDMTHGDVSGKISSECEEISRYEMEQALLAQGSDPAFIFGELND
ncbi:MAG: hypothetical protein EBX09_08105 [Actinobacteria bacterium]|nr:hypothetical protein [Actinomycetota bacterium]